MGLYSRSSGSTETVRSVEKGVFSAGKGSLSSKCRDIRLRRWRAEAEDDEEEREDARMTGREAAG